jgi:hypothetical protein
MALDDILKGIGAFNQGLQQYAASEALGTANQRLAEINQAQEQGIINQEQAFQQSSSLSNQLANTMAGMGVNASTIAQTAGRFGVSQGAQYQAMQNQKLAEQARDDAAKAVLEQRKFQSGQAALDRASAEKIAGMRANKPKMLPESFLKKIDELDQEQTIGQELLDSLEQNFEAIGPVEGRLPLQEILDKPQLVAFRADIGQFFDAYRKRITGAGAGVEEIKMLKKNRPNETDTPAVFRQKMRNTLELGRKIRARQLKRRQQAGFDLGGLAEDLERAPQVEPIPNWLKSHSQEMIDIYKRMSPEQKKRIQKGF